MGVGRDQTSLTSYKVLIASGRLENAPSIALMTIDKLIYCIKEKIVIDFSPEEAAFIEQNNSFQG